MGVRVLSVVDVAAVLFFEFGKLDGDGDIDDGAVTDGVADVVREGTDGEGEFVGGVRVAEEVDNEVSGTYVVGEVREESVGEGVVAKILNGRAAVGVGVSLLELGLGEGGVLLEKDGADGLLPGEVDQLLVGLNGIRDSLCRGEEQGEEGDGLEEVGAAWGRNRWSSLLVCFDSTHCT